MPDIVAEHTHTADQAMHPALVMHRPALLATLSEAARRARALCRPVVASYTLPIVVQDPLAVYASAEAAAATQAWYWEQPSHRLAFAAFGIATQWQVDAGDPAGMSAAWRALCADAVITVDEHLRDERLDWPLAFGGVAFDPTAAKTTLWRQFPGAALTLPQVILARDGDEATLTLTASLRPDDTADDHLSRWQMHASRLIDARYIVQGRDASPVRMLQREPIAEHAWEQMVAEAADAIRRGALAKVVLARAVERVAENAPNPVHALHYLRAAYPTATTFAVRRGAQTFLGATPEQLARVRRGHVETIALAGTSPRHASPADDARVAAALRRSAKNADEHAIVVSAIRNALAPLCGALESKREPYVRILPNVLHLETPIAGDLLSNYTLLDVVAALHPTPAVAGFPQQSALAYLREHEHLDRGWYAGALGWLDARGDGEFVVALRSALIEGSRATLFAGCGIVADSQPESEYAESRLKLRVMLEALGGEE